MYDDLEIEIDTALIKQEGGRVFRVYSNNLCIILCGLIRGEDGKKNTLLKIPPEGKHKEEIDHNCCIS